jgi:arginyl-tRNA synthetase
VVRRVLAQGADFGRSTLGGGTKIQVEFVSANPTGPLHVGHGRGAAYGASLANLLASPASRCTREYYVNDAGRQMDILALSTWLRYLELHELRPFPKNAYQGDYVRDMAAAIVALHGDALRRDAAEVWPARPTRRRSGRPSRRPDRQRQAPARPDYAYVHGYALKSSWATAATT